MTGGGRGAGRGGGRERGGEGEETENIFLYLKFNYTFHTIRAHI